MNRYTVQVGTRVANVNASSVAIAAWRGLGVLARLDRSSPAAKLSPGGTVQAYVTNIGKVWRGPNGCWTLTPPKKGERTTCYP